MPRVRREPDRARERRPPGRLLFLLPLRRRRRLFSKVVLFDEVEVVDEVVKLVAVGALNEDGALGQSVRVHLANGPPA